MEVRELLRVVALRKGKLKPAEFRHREGETGLSRFACRDRPGPLEVLDAVRRAGKQGDLAAAVIRAEEIDRLGLVAHADTRWDFVRGGERYSLRGPAAVAAPTPASSPETTRA